MVLRFCAAICGVAILFAHSSSAMAKLGTVNVYSGARGVTANGYADASPASFQHRCVRDEPSQDTLRHGGSFHGRHHRGRSVDV